MSILVAILLLSISICYSNGFVPKMSRKSIHIGATSLACSTAAPFGESVSQDYEYLDSGNQRRLERFGDTLVVRPCPSATWNSGLARSAWREAKVVYENGEWRGVDHLPKKSDGSNELDWKVAIHPNLVLNLAMSEQGQVGMFPEQINNWNWIRFMCTRAKLVMNRSGSANDGIPAAATSVVDEEDAKKNLKVLNSFAYTGGSSLAALGISGVNVTHLDASKTFVSWAQKNAESSGLRDKLGARFLVDDTMTFLQREKRRERRYHGMILDPPAFGRGPKGKGKSGSNTWKLDKDLPELVELLPDVLARKPAFLLLTCHDPKWPARKLQTLLQHAHGMPRRGIYETQEMVLRSTRGGVDLPMGHSVRVSWLMK